MLFGALVCLLLTLALTPKTWRAVCAFIPEKKRILERKGKDKSFYGTIT